MPSLQANQVVAERETKFIHNSQGIVDKGRLGIKLNLPGVEIIEQFAHAYSPHPAESPPPQVETINYR